MDWALIGRAVGMFVMTNIDDLMVLAVFFGRASGAASAGVLRIVVGQYVGFAAILIVSVLGARGAELLSEKAIPYLGLVPLFLGLRAAWGAWRQRHSDSSDGDAPPDGGGVLQVATVTFANGGDNIGVYVPVFALAGAAAMATYVVVFLIGVAVWCCAGWFLASRQTVTKALTRWGHLVFPVLLIAIGLAILVEGGAFGL